MNFINTKTLVKNRGTPPDSFLSELLCWGKKAPDDIFAPNAVADDIYAHIKPILGPWTGLPHRRAAMLEVMRVHAGFESSWNWNEGVDKTNKTSMAHITGQEAGAFQVSFDSSYLHDGAMRPFLAEHGVLTPETFIAKMKSDHQLALEYYGRLVRINVRWAGPILRHEIDPFLSRSAVTEFQALLA